MCDLGHYRSLPSYIIDDTVFGDLTSIHWGNHMALPAVLGSLCECRGYFWRRRTIATSFTVSHLRADFGVRRCLQSFDGFHKPSGGSDELAGD